MLDLKDWFFGWWKTNPLSWLLLKGPQPHTALILLYSLLWASEVAPSVFLHLSLLFFLPLVLFRVCFRVLLFRYVGSFSSHPHPAHGQKNPLAPCASVVLQSSFHILLSLWYFFFIISPSLHFFRSDMLFLSSLVWYELHSPTVLTYLSALFPNSIDLF